MMNTKILFVDDEPNILEGFQRTLRRTFDVRTAEGGAEALAIIESEGPFAVVVSDMRMPGMDGIQFLGRVMEIAPDTVRVMLTGNADQQTAVNAVNEGNIFRFLTKPCPAEILTQTLQTGLEQYRLITAEKQLLEETLNKSLEVLVEILAIVNPTAFSRSSRVKKMARQIADELGVENPWQVEIAAMLSQIGCVTVPEEILVKIAGGAPLNDRETALYHQHPEIGHDFIAQIPRMETIAEMIGSQNQRFHDETAYTADDPRLRSRVGSRILKVVLDFDKLISSRNTPQHAYLDLAERVGWYDVGVLEVLKKLIEIAPEKYVELELGVGSLTPGMVLENALMSTRGSMLLSAGQEITRSLVLRLINLAQAGIIEETVRVNVPVESQLVSVAV